MSKIINYVFLKRINAKDGFSLIDVLIALLILGFILLSIAQIIVLALYNENKARHQTTLLFYGQQQMEILLSLPIGEATDPRLTPYRVADNLQTGKNCSLVSDKNIFCFNYNNFDQDHRYPATLPYGGLKGPYYYMVWSVNLLDEALPNGARGVTLYVIPYPPPEGGYKSPVILRGIAYP